MSPSVFAPSLSSGSLSPPTSSGFPSHPHPTPTYLEPAPRSMLPCPLWRAGPCAPEAGFGKRSCGQAVAPIGESPPLGFGWVWSGGNRNKYKPFALPLTHIHNLLYFGGDLLNGYTKWPSKHYTGRLTHCQNTKPRTSTHMLAGLQPLTWKRKLLHAASILLGAEESSQLSIPNNCAVTAPRALGCSRDCRFTADLNIGKLYRKTKPCCGIVR